MAPADELERELIAGFKALTERQAVVTRSLRELVEILRAPPPQSRNAQKPQAHLRLLPPTHVAQEEEPPPSPSVEQEEARARATRATCR
jgi:hypothetical protein